MKHILFVVALLFSAPVFSQQQVCTASTRGPACHDICSMGMNWNDQLHHCVPTCASGEMWNNYMHICAPASCPPGTVGGLLHGGGYACKATTSATTGPTNTGTATTVPMCLNPANGSQLVPCKDIVPGFGDAPLRCAMTMNWDLGTPSATTIIELTQECVDEALEASSETTTRIIKLQKK